MGDSADIVARQSHGSFGALEEANKDRDAPVTETVRSLFARPVSAQVLGRFTRWNFPEDEAEDKIYSSRIVAGVIERTNVTQSIANLGTAVKDGLLTNPDTRMATAQLLDLPLDPLPEPMAEGETEDELPPPTLEPSRADLLTVAEAAQMMRVSPSTIRKLIKSGELKRAGSVSGRSRLRVEDVETFLSDDPEPEEIAEAVEGVEDPGEVEPEAGEPVSN
jgi:excisionase family DNA binding protein